MDTWAVNRARDMKPLLKFNCNQPGCRVGDDSENSWNPVLDGEIAVLAEKCEIYDVGTRTLIKSFPCEGQPAYDWSRDGKKLVTLSYEGALYSVHDVH